MTYRLRTVFISVILLLPFCVNAAMWEFGGPIDAAQAGVSPPEPYLGGGFIQALLNTDTGLFEWGVAFTGLTGPVTAAHIHEDIPPDLPVIDIGALSAPTGIGKTTGVFLGSTVLDAPTVDELTGGGGLVPGDPTIWYVNLHTSDFPGGEIRGQLVVTGVPLPAAVWMLLSACGVMLGARRFG